jgi:hypothetical protein
MIETMFDWISFPVIIEKELIIIFKVELINCLFFSKIYYLRFLTKSFDMKSLAKSLVLQKYCSSK